MKRILLLSLVFFFLPAIALAEDPDHTAAFHEIHAFVNGSNLDVGTAEVEGICSVGGGINWMSAIATVEVCSSSTSDDDGGTGAVTVVVSGLGTNHALMSETVTLNGTVPVETTGYFYRVNSVYVATAGTSQTNVGTIYVFNGTATSGVPDDSTKIWNSIAPGFGHSQSAHYTVPAGYYAIIKSAGFNSEGACRFDVKYRTNGGIFQSILTENSAGGPAFMSLGVQLALPPKCDIMMTGIAPSAATAASAHAEIKLIAE